MKIARIAPEGGATTIIVPDKNNWGKLIIHEQLPPDIWAYGLLLIAIQNQPLIPAQMVEVIPGDSCEIFDNDTHQKLARIEVFRRGQNNLPMIHTPENIDESGKPRFYPIAEGYFQGVLIPNPLKPVAAVWCYDG